MDPKEFWSKLDELGEDSVRERLASGVYGSRKVSLVNEWLRRKEAEKDDKDESTFYDNAIRWFKNHKLFAGIFILFALIIGLGSFLDAIDKMLSFGKKYAIDNEQRIILPDNSVVTGSQIPTNHMFTGWISNLNKDYIKRDSILNIDIDWENKPGGTVDLEALSLKTIEALLEYNFIALNEKQNEGPTVQQFIHFFQKNQSAKVHGYAVSPNRQDYRISLDGVLVKHQDITPELKISFYEFCKQADEITTDNDLWCWWD